MTISIYQNYTPQQLHDELMQAEFDDISEFSNALIVLCNIVDKQKTQIESLNQVIRSLGDIHP